MTNVVEILKHLISYPTVTPKECGIYDYITEILRDFRVLRFNKGEVKNLFLYKVFGENLDSKEAPHLCFAGHIDVVPPGEGWDSDPFIPTIKDGFLYGRGSQDMKGGVASFLSALTLLQEVKCRQKKIISVLLTSDEEGIGVDGTRYVLEELKKQNLLPHYAIVAEPTSDQIFGDTIKIGRRGSINGVLRIKGKQGHVAYPQKCINPVEILGAKLGEIAGYCLDNGDEDFLPSKIVVTDIRGGMEVVNVTPNDLRIMFNVRNNTLTSKEKIESYIQGVLSGIDYDLELIQNSHPFKSSKEGWLAKNLLQTIINQVGVKAVLSTSGGTSDARFFAQHQVEVLEFGVRNDRIHSLNERVRIKEVEELSYIFLDMINNFLRSNDEQSVFN
ncbi:MULTISPECIES: succinyl-diaminopimelate desuccinylase [unclassified Helicobacter]|uniref:succinyl-diaminopimelate desuccinylase n=1 Tax=unclassified Helicobacter TaxID=2593540 RepID=UPI000CF14D04|nr:MULTISPECIES: succinyl-diaminopimelate desuccinylase [unclassified Helicobacter]